MVTLGNLTSLLLSSRVQPDDSVSLTHPPHTYTPHSHNWSPALLLLILPPLEWFWLTVSLCLCFPVCCCQITRCLYTQFKKVSLHTPLSTLSGIFDHDHFALVVTSQRCFDRGGAVSEKLVVFGIVTRIDLLNFLVTNRPRGASVSSEAADGTGNIAAAAAQFRGEHKEQTEQQDKKEASSVYSIERM